MSVLDWIQKFTEDALKNNDQQRLQIVYFAQQGDILRHSNPEMAYKVYELGRTTADQLSEGCWVLFFAQRMANICIYELENLDQAMDLVTRDYVLSTQDMYQHCPINSAVRLNLVETYLYYDPVGYATKIKEVISYLNKTEAKDDFITFKLHDFLAQLHLKLNQLDLALDYALRTLDEGLGLLTLTRIYWERGDYHKVLEISEVRLEEERSSPFMLADARAWTAAMILRTNGDPIRAKSLYQQAIFHINKINFVPNSTLFDALSDYQETSGNLTEALNVRDEQLAKQQLVAGPEEYIIVRLRRARLLSRMNNKADMDTQLSEIRQYLHNVQKPAHYEQLIQLIESGYDSDVVWQHL